MSRFLKIFISILAVNILFSTVYLDQISAKSKSVDSIIIATASSGGAWYPIGGAIGELLRKHNGIKATAQVTAGSAENARLVANKKAELGMVSSETLIIAYRGEDIFKGEKLDNLRSIISMFSLDLVVIALPNAPYKNFTDLKGKRVGIGPPGSGTMVGAEALTNAYGMSFKDFKAMPFGFTDMYQGVADGSLDAMILMATHPVSGALNLATMNGIKLIPIEDKVLDKIIEKMPAFYKAVIPGGLYPGVKESYQTVGGATSLVTTADMDEEVIYTITKSILENIKEYESAHPMMKMITTQSALNGIPIPLHPGARKYYQEIKHPKLGQIPK